MTPAACVQAAIDLLDAILAATRSNGAAADTLIARYFKDRRYAGSKDRRAVRDLVYRAIRAFGDAPETGRAAMVALARQDRDLADCFDGSAHGPKAIDPNQTAPPLGQPFPSALSDLLAKPIDSRERGALLERAPLIVRVNTLRTTVEDVLSVYPDAQPFGAILPDALILPEGTAVERPDESALGLVEVQDAGSQMIVAACDAAMDMTVLDLCAGAGGKTLALAAAMAGKGRLVASDISRDRLSRLAERARRAQAGTIETRLLDPRREIEGLIDLRDACDVVLIDAPCSGSGTWRRNPEARWRINAAYVARYAAEQTRLLRIGAKLVRPGGRLVFATCSVFDAEGADQIASFLRDCTDFRTINDLPFGRPHGGGYLLSPVHDRTDGFFYAVLCK